MITSTGARAIPGTEDLTNLARVAGNNLFGAIDGSLLAGTNLRKRWCRVLACGTCGGYTALETSWTRTQVAHSSAAGLLSAAAVTTAAAGRFGAALDVIGKAGASAGDKGSAAGRALLGGYAHARSRRFPGALTVQDRSFSENISADSAKPEESRSEEDGEIMHPAVKFILHTQRFFNWS
ncbi:hypothetical protein MMC22_010285 [Lobaria immixta]|nr:hypothetical protein [Lobaria immixta]